VLTAAILALNLSIITADSDAFDPQPHSVNGYFCESAEYAMAFATAFAADADEEFAKNVVGKIAKREVCGRYVGVASIQQQETIIKKGIVYRVTALQFREDRLVRRNRRCPRSIF